ncbi:hypothetical protein ACJVDH_13785 [Pedobacter sp. AW1-32]|uniref:hypothetical protein n=1 Tax=Pedobacter sp. AW1-32 TaxID=3383026 RepID=UPI003FEFA4BC
MKTILVPTDFNIESTKIVDALLHDLPDEQLNIIFLHAFKLSDSITDMLMLSRRSRDYNNVSDDFYNTLSRYKENYSRQIAAIGIEYFYGSTVAAFKNFIENFEVEYIAYPTDYNFKSINKYSIDPKILIERSGRKIMYLDIHAQAQNENLILTKIKDSTLQTAHS